jgi:hypothetical protein
MGNSSDTSGHFGMPSRIGTEPEKRGDGNA